MATEGLQVLDYNDVNSSLVIDSVTLTSTVDTWSSRTATIPAKGGRKVKANTKTFGKFYITTDTTEVDNVLRLTFNQTFNIKEGTQIQQLNNDGQQVDAGQVIDSDGTNVFIAQYTGTKSAWEGYANTGEIRTTGGESTALTPMSLLTNHSLPLRVRLSLTFHLVWTHDSKYMVRKTSL